MSNHVWRVPAAVEKVVDGDTLHLSLDLGWHITFQARCRLIGVNAPEMSTDEGVDARNWVSAFFAEHGSEVTFVSHLLDKYGRPLGEVLVTTPQGDTLNLGAELLTAGHAVPM